MSATLVAQPTSLPADQTQALIPSKTFTWCLFGALPAAGLAALLPGGLTALAAVAVGGLLLVAALACYRAVTTFQGGELRLLVASRIVAVTATSVLLFCASGWTWLALMNAAVIWLVAERLLGRRALYELWRMVREGK